MAVRLKKEHPRPAESHLNVAPNSPTESASSPEENLSVDDRLKLLWLSRGLAGQIAAICIALLLWYTFRNSEQKAFLWPEGIAILIFNLVMRFVTQRYFGKGIGQLKAFPWEVFNNFVNMAFWAVIPASILYTFGVQSTQGTDFLIVATIWISGSIYSSGPIPWLQRVYILVTGLPAVIVGLMITDNYQGRLILWLMAIALLYFLVVGRAFSKQLRAGFEADEQVRQEKEKQRQEKEKLKGIINSLPGFVAVADQSGSWIEKSENFSHFAEIPALKAAKDEFMHSKVSSQTLQIEWDDTMPGANSKLVVYAVSFERVKYPENGIIMAGIPVTELRDTQKQLEIQRSKAEYSARLATLGEMAGGVAHEINNPLAVILGHSTQLLRELGRENLDRDKLLGKADKITKTVARIARIVQGLRTFARQGEGEPLAPTSLRALIEETMELCAAKFYQAGVHLQVEPAPEVEITARSVQISQVLMNILNNSFDAVKDAPAKIVNLKFEVSGKTLHIRITDNGPGVPEKIASKIFEPFFTTKEIGQGTGLGLSISKSIMQEHGGDLIIAKLNDPTTFELIMPLNH